MVPLCAHGNEATKECGECARETRHIINRLIIEAAPFDYHWVWVWSQGGQFAHLFPQKDPRGRNLADFQSLCGGAKQPYLLASTNWMHERNYCQNCLKRLHKEAARKIGL